MFRYVILISTDFPDFISPFFLFQLVLVSIEALADPNQLGLAKLIQRSIQSN